MKRHANVAIFVPHAGCVHDCVFCNQRGISGALAVPSDSEIAATLKQAQEELRLGMSAQVAFFGGSFTAIPRDEMLRLLQAVQPFIGSGFTGIRISTRPDAIDDEILEILLSYNVTAIELGAQSMDDTVLKASARGHTAHQLKTAAGSIKQAGFELGLQMMTGLPLQDRESARHTAEEIACLEPDTVRIYPTLVMRNTPLEKLWREGKYTPQTVKEATELSAELLEYFTNRGIKVIRLGLHDADSLRQDMLAGPYHPAFRELCESRVLLEKVHRILRECSISPQEITLAVAKGATSRMVGQKRINIHMLESEGYQVRVVENSEINYLEVEIL